MAGNPTNVAAQVRQMEAQLIGKPYWHPDASRREAEAFLKNAKPGSFVIRRSSNVGYLALSHRLEDGSIGHALVLWDGSGFTLENSNKSYTVIEALIKSLNLKLDDVKKLRVRPVTALGRPVIFQVECLCTYHGRDANELSAERADVINVVEEERGFYIGELGGRGGRIPSGLCKKVAGSEVCPPGAPQVPETESAPTDPRLAGLVGGLPTGAGLQRDGYADPDQINREMASRLPGMSSRTSASGTSEAYINNLRQQQQQMAGRVSQLERQALSETAPARRAELMTELDRAKRQLHDVDVAIQAVEHEKRMSIAGMHSGSRHGTQTQLGSQQFRASGTQPVARPPGQRQEKRMYSDAFMRDRQGRECQFEEARSNLPKYAGAVRRQVTALGNFTAEGPNEVSFVKGDLMEVLDEDDGNGWTKVRHLTSGAQGFVPTNGVR